MTTIDTLMPVLEKIVRLEGSTEPKHRIQLEKLVAELPSSFPLMWACHRVAEFNVKKARLEKALDNNREAVKEIISAEEARIAANAWQWSAGRTPPNPEDIADVKRGRALIATMESQLKDLTVENRLLVAIVDGVAEGERELKAIRDWTRYGGPVPSCVGRDLAAKHAELGLEELLPSRMHKVESNAWIDDWSLPVPEEQVPAAIPIPVAVVVEPIQHRQVRDLRRKEGETTKIFARRMLFTC